MRFTGMRHLALTVRNVDRSVAFYEQAFGMRPFGPRKVGGDVVPMVSARLRDQLTIAAAGAEREIDGSSGAPGDAGGVDHFGFVVSPRTSLDEVRAHLEKCGAEYVDEVEVAPRVPSMFFRDPDGYLFQVTRFPRYTTLYIAALPIIERFSRRRAGSSEPDRVPARA